MSSYPMYYDRLIAKVRSLFRGRALILALKTHEERNPSSAGSRLGAR